MCRGKGSFLSLGMGRGGVDSKAEESLNLPHSLGLEAPTELDRGKKQQIASSEEDEGSELPK